MAGGGTTPSVPSPPPAVASGWELKCIQERGRSADRRVNPREGVAKILQNYIKSINSRLGDLLLTYYSSNQQKLTYASTDLRVCPNLRRDRMQRAVSHFVSRTGYQRWAPGGCAGPMPPLRPPPPKHPPNPPPPPRLTRARDASKDALNARERARRTSSACHCWCIWAALMYL